MEGEGYRGYGGVVLEGFSFVAEGAQTNKNDKPDAKQGGGGKPATRPESK